MNLTDFGKSFKLDFHKEITPYKVYIKEYVKKRYISILKAIYHVSDKDGKQFIEKGRFWGKARFAFRKFFVFRVEIVF